MGRKTRRPVPTRRKPSIPRIFECPQCEAQAIKIQIADEIARIDCGACHLNMNIVGVLKLSEPVDIYGDFIDQYYDSLEQKIITEPEIVPQTPSEEKIESIEEPEVKEEEIIAEEPEEVIIEEEKPTGFFLRSKADVLKAKSTKNSKSSKS